MGLAMCILLLILRIHVIPWVTLCEVEIVIQYNFISEGDLLDLGLPQLFFIGVVTLSEVA